MSYATGSAKANVVRISITNQLVGRTTRPSEVISGRQMVLAPGTVTIGIHYLEHNLLQTGNSHMDFTQLVGPGDSWVKSIPWHDNPLWTRDSCLNLTYSISAPGNANDTVPATWLQIAPDANVSITFVYVVALQDGEAFYQANVAGTGHRSQDVDTQILPACQIAT